MSICCGPGLTQAVATINLVWVEDDPVSLSFIVHDHADEAGTYTSQIRRAYGTASTNPVLATPTVTAVACDPDGTPNVSGTDCLYTFTLNDSTMLPHSRKGYVYDIQQVGGVTRYGGAITVLGQVTL